MSDDSTPAARLADCPACGEEINAVATIERGACPECGRGLRDDISGRHRDDDSWRGLFSLATGEPHEEPDIDYGPPAGHEST